ncbi:MAG: DMT family transporter [Geminicoccaceae bacterium]|nr:DMT family transporter [Geminicoccaceae bacterium]
MIGPRGRAVGAFVLICSMWSTSGLFVRAMSEADSWQINALRTGTAGLLLLLWLLAREGRRLPLRLASVGWRPLLAVFLSYATSSNLFIYALQHTTVANTACLGATTPFWAALLAWWRLGERPSGRTVAAAALALSGAALMVGEGLALGGAGWRGDLAALGVAASFAFQIVNLRSYPREQLLPAFALAGLLTGGLVALLRGGLADLPGRDLLLGLGLGIVQMGLPTILMVWAARSLVSVEMALLSLLDTVLNPIWVFLALGERPSALGLLGGATILAAVIVAVGRRKPSPDAEREGG